MPDITNPQAIKFANEKIRPLADAYAQLYYAVKAAGQQYTAGNLSAVFTATNDLIADGSATDGRLPITSNQVRGFITQMGALLTDLEATNNTKLNVLMQIAVNPVR